VATGLGRERGIAAQGKERPGPLAWPQAVEPLLNGAVQGICPWPGLPFRRRHPWIWRTEESLAGIDLFELEQGQVVMRANLAAVTPKGIPIAVKGEMPVIRGRREKVPRPAAAGAKKIRVQVEWPRSHNGGD
jgi:hypothetical protein